MNTKQKFTKWTSITFVVALASLALSGLVMAEHEIPFAGAATYSWASFKQFNTALDQHKADQSAGLRTSDWAGFRQYNASLDTAAQTDSWTWVERYNRAFGRLGR